MLAAVALVLAGCGGGVHARISVDHPVALWDVPLRISVTGLTPNDHVPLRATSRDGTGTRYVSSTWVTADSAGRVELTRQKAMRVLSSLRPVGLKRGVDFAYYPSGQAASFTLSIDGAHTTIRRLLVAPGVHGRPIRHPFCGEFFAPATATRHRPGILVFGGSEGGLSTAGMAAFFASRGYPSLALAYFGEPGLPRNLLRVPLEYFATALRWLQQQSGVDPNRLVVEGISRDSEAAQLLGIHYPQLAHAVIAMVPANGSECGITRITAADPVTRCIGPAWMFRGKAIPYAEGTTVTVPFPDERINGPIFLDCAGLDQLWPSCPMAEAIVSRLHARGFRYRVTFLDYPDAGHGVGELVPNQIGYSSALGGLNAESNNDAAATGWPKLLEFLGALAK